MAKRKTVVPFHGTAEQEKALRELIAAHKEQQGALMPVLQGAQEIYGYLPIEVQTIIAEELNIPLAEVYGVVTFYAQFTLNPRGTYNIGVCMGTACYVKGAGDVLERIQKRLGIEPGGTTPDGRFSLDDAMDLGWPIEDNEEFETIAGYVLELADKVPHPGDVFEKDGYTFRVQSMRGRRVSLLRVSAPEPVAEPDEPTAKSDGDKDAATDKE